MKYIVRQRFSYTGSDGGQIAVRAGDVVDTELVMSWKNGDAMLRAGFLVPHDVEAGVTPTAEPTTQRAQRRRGRPRKEA